MEVSYIDHMGSDISICNAARVSFDLEVVEHITKREISLINFLAKGMSSKEWENLIDDFSLEEDKIKIERMMKDFAKTPSHFTPFTHATIQLRETVPIFVARQRFKSQVGFSYNEISRRYIKTAPEFHFPEKWRMEAENKKQGSSDIEVEFIYDPINYFNNDNRGEMDFSIHKAYEEHIDTCQKFYQCLLDSGVCPEQARMVLPQSMMTSYYVTGSLAAFARIYNLRSRSDAQKEINFLSKEWDKIIFDLFPHSWQALTQ